MSLLQVKNLVVEFPNRRGTLRALDDISFDIAPGEILGVVGESGAGKSLTGRSCSKVNVSTTSAPTRCVTSAGARSAPSSRTR
jgi:ABC-type glutathione transport system ATPase component